MARIPFLSALIPADAAFWFSLDENHESGDDAVSVRDEQGVFDLSGASTYPKWRELTTGEKYLLFDGTNSPLKSGADVGDFMLKHIFIVAAYANAAFSDYSGLITRFAASVGMLVSNNSGTKFVDFSLPALEYRKSGVSYAASNMQAPMSGQPELIELYYPTGFAVDNIQIGKDRDLSGRLWNGRVDFAFGLERAASSLELRQIRLYAQLRSRLWLSLNQTLDFPAPEIIFDGVAGASSTTYSRMYSVPLDFEETTNSHKYDDGSKTFNTTNLLPPRRWQVEFNGISAAKAQVLDAFAENVGLNYTFNFYDYKRDKTYSGVRVERYNREHDGYKSYRNNCRFDLVKY